MKKSFFLVILTLPASLIAQEASPAATTLHWENIASTYLSFEDLKPALINKSTVPIYLSRLWPNSSAQLDCYNQSTGVWEIGKWSGTCATVVKPTQPIEIKPNSRHDIHVYWQLSTDDWDQPTRFVVYGSRASRPLEGRYRFALRYALQPWTLIHHPSATYRATSPEFLLLEP